jgi:hypothetical protein
MIGCDEPTREKGELEYPDDPEKTASNGERYRVSAYGANFCSSYHEVKYDHIKADARDAKRAEEQSRGTDKSDLPEYDGPPY